MIRVIVTGAAGRMGKRLISLIHEHKGFQLVGATEMSDHPLLGHDAGEVAGCGHLGIPIQDTLESCLARAEVIIDFTSPSATLRHLRQAVNAQRAMVIGTTGFTESERHTLEHLASSIPCVAAPNMSVGINVLLHLLPQVVRALDERYDIEVIEAHHNKKKDAPSGTALWLANTLARASGQNLAEVGVFARHGIIGERRAGEIGVQSIRAGDIVGDHTVLFGGPGERLELTHRAHTRDTFAQGALRAAVWVVTRPPGLYTMAHVLGFASS